MSLFTCVEWVFRVEWSCSKLAEVGLAKLNPTRWSQVLRVALWQNFRLEEKGERSKDATRSKGHRY